MAQQDILFRGHLVNGLVPQADAFASAATTDWVSLEHYNRATFIIHTGDSTSGTSDGVVTLQSSAVAAGSSPTALAFKYRTCASSTSVDTWGEITEATSTGFVMTAADNYIYIVTVTGDDVVAQDADGKFVALTVTEDTNDPIVASVLVYLDEATHPEEVPITAIA